MSIAPGPGGIRVEIRPLARSPRMRRRLLGLAVLILLAAFVGGARLGASWEAGLRKGDFSDLPLPILLALSLSIGVSTPLALLGLAALAFGEETIEINERSITIATTAFEHTRMQRIDRSDLECWRETLWPLPPWWTWSVQRLAARAGGRMHPLGLAARKTTDRPGPRARHAEAPGRGFRTRPRGGRGRGRSRGRLRENC